MQNYKPAVSQSCAVAKSEKYDGPLYNQTWQTEWKTASLATEQLCEYENQTLEAFVAASRLFAKFDCPVVFLNCSLLATAHDRETALLFCKTQSRTQSLLASYCACSSMRCKKLEGSGYEIV